jgi:hypothetical protein
MRRSCDIDLRSEPRFLKKRGHCQRCFTWDLIRRKSEHLDLRAFTGPVRVTALAMFDPMPATFGPDTS